MLRLVNQSSRLLPLALQPVLKYGGCALGIAGAATGLGLVGAIMACTLLLYDPAPPAGDGQ